MLAFMAGASASFAPGSFPAAWGAPEGAVEGSRPLPGGFGHGSDALFTWIEGRAPPLPLKPSSAACIIVHWMGYSRVRPTPCAGMKADAATGTRNFPPPWGEPPRAMTRDLRPLPFGYGMGSGTLARWITEKAQEVSGESPEEYEQAKGNA